MLVFVAAVGRCVCLVCLLLNFSVSSQNCGKCIDTMKIKKEIENHDPKPIWYGSILCLVVIDRERM